MEYSALDLFSIGIGPSSSHTVGPMRAARDFVRKIEKLGLTASLSGLHCDLYGSLASTGKGHGTDAALILGFMGASPSTVDVEKAPTRVRSVQESGVLPIPWGREIAFDAKKDLDFKRLKPLPLHPNGMHFTAVGGNGEALLDEVIYSVGGGFIATESELRDGKRPDISVQHPFASASELLTRCDQTGFSICELMRVNEGAFRPDGETSAKLDAIWAAMQDCVRNGCEHEGLLPGGLKVRRRARAIAERLRSSPEESLSDPLTILDWVNLYALAVNEENAAGGRVVTAPTNGAAGIIPAVLHYAVRFRRPLHPDGVHRFLLTAGAIGLLYKRNASISGAEAGCQGEVGVACSMAAAGLVEFLGGTPRQVANAAEIGMEHNLGLTCDPIGGLVQIPCIERNAMGAVKAINACRLALSGDGTHMVSLDKVIRTMRETGRDMKSKYKETSRGGLAVSVVEC